jgi:hypothetical protein
MAAPNKPVRPAGRLRRTGVRPENTPLFSRLESSGRFHRDSAIGRLFHPGTVSYREITTTDSVHLAVRPDNRVSVHVDRYSPLVVRSGRCRYSLVRALAHNMAVAVERSARLLIGRRRNHQPTCHLDCEIRWVPDDCDTALAEDAAAEVTVRA